MTLKDPKDPGNINWLGELYSYSQDTSQSGFYESPNAQAKQLALLDSSFHLQERYEQPPLMTQVSSYSVYKPYNREEMIVPIRLENDRRKQRMTIVSFI